MMLAAERGAAANTLSAYARDLAGAQEAIGDLIGADQSALASLGQVWAGLAPASLARKCSALRQFYGFLVDEKLRADDPSSALPRPRAQRKLPRLLSHEEISALFAQAEADAATERREAVRLLALLELLYGSGLRASELVSLTCDAVPRDAPFLTITGKGGQQRLTPVSTRARQALTRWLALRQAGGRHLFPSRSAAGHLTRVRLILRSAQGSIRKSSVRMFYAMLSPRICWKEGLICGFCKPCWATLISSRRKYILMSTAPDWWPWSTPGIRWPERL
jgi:integrase/recombinase XerD